MLILHNPAFGRYHYFRIFNSFVEAYTPCYVEPATEAKYMGVGQIDPLRCDADKYGWSATGQPFNDAYRYVRGPVDFH